MGSGKHNFKQGKDWDKFTPCTEYFTELFRVSKNQIIWGGNYFSLELNNNWIIWDKLNPNLSFSEAELAWCSINKNVRVFKRYSAMEDDDCHDYGFELTACELDKEYYDKAIERIKNHVAQLKLF